MARDIEIELDYDEEVVTIVTPDGVYDYDMTDDKMDLADFLVEGGAGYSVYSQQDDWIAEVSYLMDERRQLREREKELDREIEELRKRRRR